MSFVINIDGPAIHCLYRIAKRLHYTHNFIMFAANTTGKDRLNRIATIIESHHRNVDNNSISKNRYKDTCLGCYGCCIENDNCFGNCKRMVTLMGYVSTIAYEAALTVIRDMDKENVRICLDEDVTVANGKSRHERCYSKCVELFELFENKMKENVILYVYSKSSHIDSVAAPRYLRDEDVILDYANMMDLKRIDGDGNNVDNSDVQMKRKVLHQLVLENFRILHGLLLSRLSDTGKVVFVNVDNYYCTDCSGGTVSIDSAAAEYPCEGDDAMCEFINERLKELKCL